MGNLLCAVVLTSSTKSAIVGDAIRSCRDWVDHFVVIHLVDDGAEDDTREIINSLASGRVTVADQVISGTYIHQWRNAGLALAHELGYQWAMQLDTDERMIHGGINIRATLQKLPAKCQTLLVQDDKGHYDKPRFFRLPAVGCYEGVNGVHEDYRSDPSTSAVMPGVKFHELEKSPEALRARLIGDLRGLDEQIKAEPEVARWHYYRASTLAALGWDKDAVGSFFDSFRVAGDDHGIKAWCCYQAAGCYARLKDHKAALMTICEGMIWASHLPELPWFASVQCLQMDRVEDAIAWAKMAISLGHETKRHDSRTRVGFREAGAHMDYPYEVLAEAYRRVGHETLCKWAIKTARKLKAEREGK